MLGYCHISQFPVKLLLAQPNLFRSIRIKHMLGQVNNEGRLDPKERHEIGTRVRRPLFMRCLYRASIKKRIKHTAHLGSPQTQRVISNDDAATMQQSFPMNGGDGPHSYRNNSHFQVFELLL